MDPVTIGLLVAAGVVVVEDDGSKAKPSPVAPGGVRSYISGRRLSAPVTSAAKTTTPVLTKPYAVTTANGLPGDVALAVKLELETAWNALSASARKSACERLRARFASASNIQSLNCSTATFALLLSATTSAVGFQNTPATSALGVLSLAILQVDINTIINAVIPLETPSGEPIKIPSSKEEAAQQGADEAAKQVGTAVGALTGDAPSITSWLDGLNG